MRTVYARKCDVREVSKEDAQDFIEKWHRSGALSVGKQLSLGLFEKGHDKLLGLVQFGAPRTSLKKREYSVELLRMCFLGDVRIPGGASKMFKYFFREYRPSDVFTYQDTTGETTDVYESCGLNFVSEGSKKMYLVAPGLTLETANRKNRREILAPNIAAVLGPDQLLNENLGEVFEEDGTRRSNVDIFVKNLGWSKEYTTGDRVYDWFDENVSFYVYQLTNEKGEYFYGVRDLDIPVNEISDTILFSDRCVSGLPSRFLTGVVRKDIYGVFSHRAPAYALREELVEKNRSTLCKNKRDLRAESFLPQYAVFDTTFCMLHGGEVKSVDGLCVWCEQSMVIRGKNYSDNGSK